MVTVVTDLVAMLIGVETELDKIRGVEAADDSGGPDVLIRRWPAAPRA